MVAKKEIFKMQKEKKASVNPEIYIQGIYHLDVSKITFFR